MTDETRLKDITKHIERVTHKQTLFNRSLERIAGQLKDADIDNDARKQYAQLTLQLRLDTQDTLKALIKNHKSFCNALGINPLNSQFQNLERLQYSLSADDFDLDLINLEALLDQLETAYLSDAHTREAAELKRQKLRKLLEKIKSLNKAKEYKALDNLIDKTLAQETPRERGKKLAHGRDHDSISHELTTAIEYQNQFQHSVAQLTEAIKVFGHVPKFGMIYDYLAGLKGPISRYQLAMQNGLALITQIGQQLLHDHKPDLQNLQQRTQALLKKTMPNTSHYLAQDLSKTLQQGPTVEPTAETQIKTATIKQKNSNLFGR